MAWQQKFHLLIQFYYFHCHLTHSLFVGSHMSHASTSSMATVMGASGCQEGWLECFRLFRPSAHPVEHMVCWTSVQHAYRQCTGKTACTCRTARGTVVVGVAPCSRRRRTRSSPLWEHFTSEHCIISCIDHTYWHSSTPENHRKLHFQNFKCSHYRLKRAGGWCRYRAALTMAVSVRARIYRQFFLCSMRYSLDTQLSKP